MVAYRRQERKTNLCVWNQDLEEHLCSDVLQQVVNVILHERIFQNCLSIVFQNFFESLDIASFISRHQVGHGKDFSVVLVSELYENLFQAA